MRYSYSLLVMAVYAVGAALVELLAHGLKWLGVSDLTYYLLSGTACVMLVIDIVLFVLLSFRAAQHAYRAWRPG